jgi:hypothetical protein
MKLSITIHGNCPWLKDLAEEAYDTLIDRIEDRVRKEHTGLPWTFEECPDIGPTVYRWELQDNFEVSLAVETDGSTQGMSWILYDFWAEEKPPDDCL